VAAAFWVGRITGYSAGLDTGYIAGPNDKGPEHRFLVVVTRAQASATSGSSRFTYFNIRDPGDAANLAKEEERLKSAGAEYYIAKGRVETTIHPEPDPRGVHSHR
jgi:hypothetical protein